MTQATDTEIRDLILALDKKLGDKIDAIAADVVEVKIAQARTDERFNSIDQRFNSIDQRFSALEADISDIKTQLRGQDARLWGFVVALFLALTGVLTKVVFFPQV